MAYNGNFLSRIEQTWEGGAGYFVYIANYAATTVNGVAGIFAYGTPPGDNLGQVLATGYFSDGSKRGMQLGDIVNVYVNGFSTECMVSALGVSASVPGGVAQPVTVVPLISQAQYLANNFRNLIDGGDAGKNPFQRGTTFSGIGATLTYTADRFFLQGGAGSSAAVAQTATTSVAGFQDAFGITRSGASTSVSTITFGQITETADAASMQGLPVTLSFWAMSQAGFSATGNLLQVTVAMGTGTNQSAASAVAGTWTGQANVISATQALTSAGPVRYSFYGSVPTSCTELATLLAWTPTGTAAAGDGYFLWGVQLEPGYGPTSFEHRDIQVEVEICQRYFFQINETISGSVVGAGMIAGTNAETIFIPLPVQMRVAPTVTVVAGSFAFNIVGTLTAVSGFAAGSTHTVNYVNVVGTTTAVSGQATLLVSRSPNSGSIAITADL